MHMVDVVDMHLAKGEARTKARARANIKAKREREAPNTKLSCRN